LHVAAITLVEHRLVWQLRGDEAGQAADVREGLFDQRALDDRAVAGRDRGDVEALDPIDVAPVLVLVPEA
jgi:hypothetical protein